MTVLMAPHPAEVLIERNGYIEEMLSGKQYYVTTDDLGRSVIGPKRHRAKPSMFRKRKSLKEKTTPVQSQPDPNDPDATDVILTGEEVSTDEVQEAVVLPRWKAWLVEQRRVWRNRMQDEQWHQTARHIAVDIFVWSMCGSLATIFIKGAWWVITL